MKYRPGMLVSLKEDISGLSVYKSDDVDDFVIVDRLKGGDLVLVLTAEEKSPTVEHNSQIWVLTPRLELGLIIMTPPFSKFFNRVRS